LNSYLAYKVIHSRT